MNWKRVTYYLPWMDVNLSDHKLPLIPWVTALKITQQWLASSAWSGMWKLRHVELLIKILLLFHTQWEKTWNWKSDEDNYFLEIGVYGWGDGRRTQGKIIGLLQISRSEFSNYCMCFSWCLCAMAWTNSIVFCLSFRASLSLNVLKASVHETIATFQSPNSGCWNYSALKYFYNIQLNCLYLHLFYNFTVLDRHRYIK